MRDPRRYEEVVALVPIVCLDVIPLCPRSGACLLIRRWLPSGGLGWNIVGGGVYREETLDHALARHVSSTLGPDVAWDLPQLERPDAVEQYLPNPRSGFAHDPRKHAIALTYLLPLTGEPVASGEAEEVRWFTPADLPLPQEFGFGQGPLVHRLVAHWAGLASSRPSCKPY